MAAGQYQKKSNYQSNSGGYQSRGNNQQSGGGAGDKSTATTHYAYRLPRDADGKLIKNEDGKVEKEFLNDMRIYANETQYGETLTVRTPQGDYYIARKKAK